MLNEPYHLPFITSFHGITLKPEHRIFAKSILGNIKSKSYTWHDDRRNILFHHISCALLHLLHDTKLSRDYSLYMTKHTLNALTPDTLRHVFSEPPYNIHWKVREDHASCDIRDFFEISGESGSYPAVNFRDHTAYLSTNDVKKLYKKTVFARYMQNIRGYNIMQCPDFIKSLVRKSRQYRPRYTSYSNTNKKPPCIMNALNLLYNGQNVTHSGRVLLAAYLHGVGMDESSILDTFRNAPNFDEEKSKRQIAYITHHDFMPSNCSKVQASDCCELCDPDKNCKNIKNPIQYHD